MKTNEELRVMVAEEMGWKFEKKPRKNMNSKIPAWHLKSPTGIERCGEEVWFDTRYGKESNYAAFQGELNEYLDRVNVPNYPESLDCCAEFEATLDDEEQWKYAGYITQQVGFDRAMDSTFILTTATPRQRCIAFLKVRGKL